MSVVRAAHPATTLQNRRKFVAWRLHFKRGARDASHIELESAEAWLERFEVFCGAMVFFGVAFEVFIAAANPAYGKPMERWGSTIADAFVALGVLGEIVAGSRGRVIQGEFTIHSNQKLAKAVKVAGEANERAAETLRQLAELEQLAGWRSISEGSSKRIGSVIASLSVDIRLGIGAIPNDPEASHFTYAIANCFLKAGIGSFSSEMVQPEFRSPFGVYLCTSEEINEYKIAAAFAAEGVHVECSSVDFSSIFHPRNGGPNVCFFVAAKQIPGYGGHPYEAVDQVTTQRIRPHTKRTADGKFVRL